MEPEKGGSDQAVGSNAPPGKTEETKKPGDGGTPDGGKVEKKDVPRTDRPPHDRGKVHGEKKGVGKEKINFSEEDLQ